MSIILFALLGAATEVGTAYWICFGVYCVFRVLKAVTATIKEMQ